MEPLSETFLVRIPLVEPVILSPYQTGDAILTGARYEDTEDVGRIDPTSGRCDIPLARTPMLGWALWHTSAIMWEKPYRVVRHQIGQSLARDLMLERHHFEVPVGRKINTQFGDDRNIMNTYEAIETNAVWFAAQGDRDAVVDMFATIPSIGTLRQKGMGQIRLDGVDSRRLKRGNGMIDLGANVVRPVPKAYADQQRWSGKVGQSLRWRNPYRNSPVAACLAPLPTDLAISRSDLRGMFGS